MTNFTKNLMAAAAALVVSAGLASAQTMLKADVPFAFQVNGKVMSAGTYRVANVSTNGVPVFALRSDDGQSIVTLPGSSHDADKAWRADRQPRLAFECAADNCALSQVWAGGDAPAYNIGHRKTVDINRHIAVVVMRPEKGD